MINVHECLRLLLVIITFSVQRCFLRRRLSLMGLNYVSKPILSAQFRIHITILLLYSSIFFFSNERLQFRDLGFLRTSSSASTTVVDVQHLEEPTRFGGKHDVPNGQSKHDTRCEPYGSCNPTQDLF